MAKDVNEANEFEAEEVIPEETTEEMTADAEQASDSEEKTEEAPEEENSGEEKKKSGFFKKKKDKKDEQIEELTAKVEALNDQMVRNLAEFDNFRKRTNKEMEAKFDLGAKNVIEKMLPVIDNFERGLATMTQEEIESQPFAQGMDRTYRQLLKQLEELGVEPIAAVGEQFDPAFHNAVMQEPAGDGVEANTILEEYQKGYTFHGYVVRYSMVKVAI